MVLEISDLEMFSFAIAAVGMVVLLPMMIASWIGLFQHRNWARWLYLLSLVIGVLLSVFCGCFSWNYRWGVVEALEYFGHLVSALIVAICFLSPLATEFSSSSPDISWAYFGGSNSLRLGFLV